MKFRRVITAALALVLAAAPIQAAAAGAELIDGQEAAAVLLENRLENVFVQQPREASGEELPEKFDLRELGVVTPVKNQTPWGTCWGFSAIAAAETSILSDMGKTYDETGLDLSEHHLTYFSYMPVADDTQAGEGLHALDEDKMFDLGGIMFMASSVFSSGVGVVPEELIPYRGRNSLTVSDDETHINYYYNWKDDWSLPEEYRLLQSFQLEESNILPCAAVYAPNTPEDGWGREVGYVGYDASATEMFKKELLAGRAISVAFHADQYMPGSDGPVRYINEETWSHFTFNSAPANHAVTIVGYDDNYPAANFLDHSDDPYGDGLTHLPEGNGAWIVKNSWGAETEAFPNNSDWGIVNEEGKHTGYFYLSYYDRSICLGETFTFNTEENTESYIIDQYDFLPSESPEGWCDTTALKMANIFEAEFDSVIRNVSCETSAQNASVTYEVYLMDEQDTVPTDGTLAAAVSAQYRFPGYHRIALTEPVAVSKGQRYAVVVTQTAEADGTVYYSLSTDCALNESGMKAFNYLTVLTNPDARTAGSYAVGIVNPGESMVYIDALGGWADWAEIVPELQKVREYRYMDFDNFPVKAYLNFTNPDDIDTTPLPPLTFAPPAGQYDTSAS